MQWFYVSCSSSQNAHKASSLKSESNVIENSNSYITVRYQSINIPPHREPIRTIINNCYHISSMLLAASRKIRTNISQGIYEARYDRKIARMVEQSILVGL